MTKQKAKKKVVPVTFRITEEQRKFIKKENGEFNGESAMVRFMIEHFIEFYSDNKK